MNPSLILDLLGKADKLIGQNFTIVPNSTLQSLTHEITLLWILVAILGVLFVSAFATKWDEGVIGWIKRLFRRIK